MTLVDCAEAATRAPPCKGLSRRNLARLIAATMAMVAVGAHTPYGQWTVYRQFFFVLLGFLSDRHAVGGAEARAVGLARELPESHARMTRASDPVRIASLLATGQLDVAIVSRSEAAGMSSGSGAYRAVGPVPIRTLAELGAHFFVTVETLKERHAYLLAAAVEHLRSSLPVVAAEATSSQPLTLPEHPGAAAYRGGAPLPDSDLPAPN